MSELLSGANLRLVAALLLALGVAYGAWRNRPRRGATTLAAFMLAVVSMIVGHLGAHVLGTVVADPAAEHLQRLAIQFRWIGLAAVAFVWVAFVVDYTGRRDLLTRRALVVLFAWPAVLVALIWIPDVAGLGGLDLETGVFPALEEERSLYLWHVGLSYVLLLVGCGLVVRYVHRTNRLFRRQGAVLVGGMGIMIALSLVAVFELSAGDVHVHYLQIGFIVMGLAFFWGVFRASLTDIAPVARSAILEDLTAGVLVADGDGRVVDANPMARRLLGDADERILGADLADLTGQYPGLRAAIEGDDPGSERVSIPTDVGERVLSIDVTPVTERGSRVATAVIMYDVTELTHRERDLDLMKQVFSRFIRHNLRNDLSVTMGHAQVLAETDQQREHRARKILDVTSSLVESARKARQVEQAVDREDPAGNLDLAWIVRVTVETFRDEYPDATIRTDLPDEAWVYAHTDVELAVENLVENAIVHNGGDDRRVTIAVAPDADGWITLGVEDNGPGIDPEEVAAIQSGTEEDLHHGSGIGLYLTRWIVTQTGGDLSFDVDEGTRATVHLRAGTADDALTADAGDRMSGSATQ